MNSQSKKKQTQKTSDKHFLSVSHTPFPRISVVYDCWFVCELRTNWIKQKKDYDILIRIWLTEFGGSHFTRLSVQLSATVDLLLFISSISLKCAQFNQFYLHIISNDWKIPAHIYFAYNF